MGKNYYHFTLDDETKRKFVLRVKSRGILWPCTWNSEENFPEESEGISPTFPEESATELDMAGASWTTKPFSAFS